MFKKLLVGATFSALALTLLSWSKVYADIPANEPSTIAKPSNEKKSVDIDFLKAKIEKTLGLSVAKIETTPISGIALAVTDRGIFYTSADGEYLIQGKLFSLGNNVVDLTEQKLTELRLQGLKNFKEDEIIVYKAKDEKYVVNVFTDITCGYCRKMHAEMDGYNERGITFRYLAYPRAGINDRTGGLSQGFKDLRSVWCNEDPAMALTRAKSGGNVAARICEAPIEEQFNFGRQIGVSGTPAIILSDGSMIPGYQPPAKLEQILKTI